VTPREGGITFGQIHAGNSVLRSEIIHNPTGIGTNFCTSESSSQETVRASLLRTGSREKLGRRCHDVAMMWISAVSLGLAAAGGFFSREFARGACPLGKCRVRL